MRKVIIFFALFTVFALQTGCVSREQQRFTKTYYGYFDTVITLTGYAERQAEFDEASALAEREFERLHKIFDIYAPHEGVRGAYILNHSSGERVEIDKELMELLLFAKEHYEETGARVNIAMGAVLALWHDARESQTPPSSDALKAADAHSALSNLELDPDGMTAHLLDPETRIDLGAVAKGFAVEKVALLLSGTFKSFLIDAGGNIRAGDPPSGRDSYNIGVVDPLAALEGGSEVLLTLPLKNASAVTSGGYQRTFTYGGRDYHHLIDPDTLMPADFVKQVTIIAEDSALADLLSTAAFLLPYEQSRAMVEQTGVDAIWVLNDGTVEQTTR